jgi:hypothetical protein
VSTTQDNWDDIDARIAERFATLDKNERAPAGMKARVLRHYDRVRHANKVLGWPYTLIANDLLKPAGVMISPNTLRNYMEQFARTRERPSAKGKRTRTTTPKRPGPDHDDDASDTPEDAEAAAHSVTRKSPARTRDLAPGALR